MRLQATSATQPTVPATQPVPTAQTPVQTKPSFKGSDDARDLWEKNKSEFEDLSSNPENPTFVKKIGKAGVVLATGILGYGTAKFGMRKSLDLVSGIIKSKPVQAASAKATGFVKEILIPDAKNVFASIKNSKLSQKLSQKIDAAIISAEQTNIGKKVGEKIASVAEKISTFAKKEKVAKVINFVSAAVSKAKAKMTEAFSTAASKIPTAEKAKNGTIEVLATGSGMAAAIEGSTMNNNEQEWYGN